MYLTRLLLAIWFFGVTGVSIELLLLGHFEDPPQVIPLALLAVGLVTGLWYAARPTRVSLRTYQAVLLAFAAGGVAGLWLHYRGNVAFELEMYPGLSGFPLFKQAVTGATPTLAPGTMMVLAAVGYAATVARSRPTS